MGAHALSNEICQKQYTDIDVYVAWRDVQLFN